MLAIILLGHNIIIFCDMYVIDLDDDMHDQCNNCVKIIFLVLKVKVYLI